VTTVELLTQLRALNVKVWLEGDRVRCNAPLGVLTGDLRQSLAERKPEIRALLRAAGHLTRNTTVVPIQQGGLRRPFYAVPGHNGDVFCFVRLAQQLGADQPFFGLQPPGLDGRPPCERIEDLAAHFVDAIRISQPRGPYLIGGYCLGGTTAFEIARQLQAAGQEVGALVLMGTAAPASFRLTRRVLGSVKEWVRNSAAGAKALVRAEPAERAALLRAKAAGLFSPKPQSERASIAACRERVELATVNAARAYTPGRYSGRIHVCLPNRADERSDECFVDWGRFASQGAEVMAGPDRCQHDFMLREPDVRIFADYLRGCFARAGERSFGLPSVAEQEAIR